MKFEVEVYMRTDAGNAGCEVMEIDCKNRAEAKLRAEQVIRDAYAGLEFRITRIVPKLIREAPHA